MNNDLDGVSQGLHVTAKSLIEVFSRIIDVYRPRVERVIVPNDDDFIKHVEGAFTEYDLNIPERNPLLEYFIETMRRYLESWGFHWREARDTDGKPIPWMFEFSKKPFSEKEDERAANATTVRDAGTQGTDASEPTISARRHVLDLHANLAENTRFVVNMRSLFKKRLFKTKEEIELFVPRFIKHTMYGLTAHMLYFAEKSLDALDPDLVVCEPYIQVVARSRHYIMRSVRAELEGQNQKQKRETLELLKRASKAVMQQIGLKSSRTGDLSQEQWPLDKEEQAKMEEALKRAHEAWVIERKENLHLLWGVGCDLIFNVGTKTVFPSQEGGDENDRLQALKQWWREDLERRDLDMTVHSAWNGQVMLLFSESQLLSELYLLDDQFAPHVLSILGERCPRGEYFFGLLTERALLLMRRNRPDGSVLSKTACQTFFKRLGLFLSEKIGEFPLLLGLETLFDEHEGRFFQWNGEVVGSPPLRSLHLEGEVTELFTPEVSDAELELFYQVYERLKQEPNSIIPLLSEELSREELKERLRKEKIEFNPFNPIYFEKWIKVLPPLDETVKRHLHAIADHLDELPVLHDYFPENPLSVMSKPLIWPFEVRYVIGLKEPSRNMVLASLETVWHDAFSISDLRKFQLALIIIQFILARALTVELEDLFVVLDQPILFRIIPTIQDLKEFNQLSRSLDLRDFEIAKRDAIAILQRLRQHSESLTPFWRIVIDSAFNT